MDVPPPFWRLGPPSPPPSRKNRKSQEGGSPRREEEGGPRGRAMRTTKGRPLFKTGIGVGKPQMHGGGAGALTTLSTQPSSQKQLHAKIDMKMPGFRIFSLLIYRSIQHK